MVDYLLTEVIPVISCRFAMTGAKVLKITTQQLQRHISIFIVHRLVLV